MLQLKLHKMNLEVRIFVKKDICLFLCLLFVIHVDQMYNWKTIQMYVQNDSNISILNISKSHILQTCHCDYSNVSYTEKVQFILPSSDFDTHHFSPLHSLKLTPTPTSVLSWSSVLVLRNSQCYCTCWLLWMCTVIHVRTFKVHIRHSCVYIYTPWRCAEFTFRR